LISNSTCTATKRCAIAPSYCTKLVEVMRELQRRRQASRAFAGKDGFITARDLFRWANRQSNGYDELAADGFRVLGERLRSVGGCTRCIQL
jgi:midasin